MTAITRGRLVFLALLAVALFAWAQARRQEIPTPWRDEKVAAAARADRSLQALAQAAASLGIPLDPLNDPLATGIVGPEFSAISTDRGVLASKLAVTNPNFAAAIVDMLKEANLRKGDPIAVAFTGSFPGANVAVLAACEVLELEPIVITSLGASSFGATNPEWTWLDMEAVLRESGLTRVRSVAATYGGGKDRGRGLSEEGRAMLKDAALRHHVPLIEPETLDEAIARRMAIYDSVASTLPGRQVRAAINVGGGLASLGATVNGRVIPSGLVTRLARQNFPARGTLIRFADRGLPILHLLEMEQVARHQRLPMDPGLFGAVARGPAFAEIRYDPWSSAAALLVLLTAVIVAARVPACRRCRTVET